MEDIVAVWSGCFDGDDVIPSLDVITKKLSDIENVQQTCPQRRLIFRKLGTLDNSVVTLQFVETLFICTTQAVASSCLKDGDFHTANLLYGSVL